MTSMASKTFHRFPLLPREIRNEIFLYATSPRIVHVQLVKTENDDNEQEEFEEWLVNLVPAEAAQIKLHPSLAYFVHNWGPNVQSYRDRHSQQILESYGFTNSKPVQYLWENPQISINWLQGHPTVAYQLLRKNHLYSTAPIPALLHTCGESREALIRAGYQLAFGSRNHEPHTWFNYDSDVLYIGGDHRQLSGHGSLLSCSDWIVGEIDPESLQQVRKLALDDACYHLVNKSWRREVLNAIRLLPRLEVLYMTEDKRLRDEWRSSSCLLFSTQDTDTTLQSGNYTREGWRFVPIEEVDCLFSVLSGHSRFCSDSATLGYQGSRLRYFQGPSGQYFQTLIDQFTEYLGDEKEKMSRQRGVVSWQIPKIEMVHVCTEPTARVLFEERHRIWDKLVLLKRRQALWEQQQNKRRNERANKRPCRCYNTGRYRVFDVDDTPPSPTELEWQDDWEAFDEANGDHHYGEPAGYYLEYLVKHGTIFPPSQELSLEP
ncbi:hypothetical protein F4821DRAFT_221895 [Hypoxylon rubiginosum]|uniref:Uncharacterized protein n=1 Tax=Hypoxylon rubiginosum TaxID=110542 RepID=A0ACC0DMI2_9PEZI|nr:hypothetical protein F4821DRAFT_221895 [Hypoxylon rubiginosum]